MSIDKDLLDRLMEGRSPGNLRCNSLAQTSPLSNRFSSRARAAAFCLARTLMEKVIVASIA